MHGFTLLKPCPLTPPPRSPRRLTHNRGQHETTPHETCILLRTGRCRRSDPEGTYPPPRNLEFLAHEDRDGDVADREPFRVQGGSYQSKKRGQVFITASDETNSGHASGQGGGGYASPIPHSGLALFPLFTSICLGRRPSATQRDKKNSSSSLLSVGYNNNDQDDNVDEDGLWILGVSEVPVAEGPPGPPHPTITHNSLAHHHHASPSPSLISQTRMEHLPRPIWGARQAPGRITHAVAFCTGNHGVPGVHKGMVSNLCSYCFSGRLWPWNFVSCISCVTVRYDDAGPRGVCYHRTASGSSS